MDNENNNMEQNTTPPLQQPQAPFTQSNAPLAPPSAPPTTPPGMPSSGGVVAVKSGNKKTPVIIAIIIAAVVFLGVIGFFVFRKPIAAAMRVKKIEKDPKATLTESLDLTFVNIEETSSGLPDFDQFKGQPLGQKADISVAAIADSYYAEYFGGAGSKIHINARSDFKNKEMLLEYAMETPYFSMEKSSLYISPDNVALSVPTFYRNHDFISIDTKNFVRDWNRSEFNDGGYYEINKSFDLQKTIANGFELLQKTSEGSATLNEMSEELSKESKKIIERLKDRLDVKFTGDKGEYFEFTAVASARDVEDAIDAYASLAEEMIYSFYEDTVFSAANLLEGFGVSDPGYMKEYMTENLREAIDEIKGIIVKNDVELLIKIDKNTMMINELEADRISLYHEDSDSSDAIDFDLHVEFGGDKNLIDDMVIDIGIKDKSDNEYAPESVDVRITRRAPDDEKLIGSRWEVTNKTKYSEKAVYGTSQTIVVFFDFSWDPEDTKSNSNMSIKYGVKNKEQDFEAYVTLRGNLKEEKEKLVLSDGKLSLMNASTEMMAFLIDYEVEVIAPGTIAPSNLNRSIDFFKVDWEKVFDEIQDMV